MSSLEKTIKMTGDWDYCGPGTYTGVNDSSVEVRVTSSDDENLPTVNVDGRPIVGAPVPPDGSWQSDATNGAHWWVKGRKDGRVIIQIGS